MELATFSSHLRSGLAAFAPAAASSDVELDVAAGSELRTVSVQLELAGPGAVLGLHQDVVTRRTPEPDSVSVRPGTLVAAELADPGLPWRYATQAPTAGRVAPWLALLVLPAEAVTLETRSQPVPRVHASGVATWLPDLDESWAWAHVEGGARPGTSRPARSRGCCVRAG